MGHDIKSIRQQFKATECAARLHNAVIKAGDTLINPAFTDFRFKGIVANPPFNLSPQHYVQPPVPEKPNIDPWALEVKARASIIRILSVQIQFHKDIAEFEGWGIEPFLDEIQGVINIFRVK